MTIESILAQLDTEIARLTQARALLSNAGKVKVTAAGAKLTAVPVKKAAKRRVLSPEARKRISDAQRKRWAAQHAKTTKKAK